MANFKENSMNDVTRLEDEILYSVAPGTVKAFMCKCTDKTGIPQVTDYEEFQQTVNKIMEYVNRGDLIIEDSVNESQTGHRFVSMITVRRSITLSY